MNAEEKLPDNPVSFEEAAQHMEEFARLKDDLLTFANRFRGRTGVDQRWLAIGITDVEKGYLGIAHAIFSAPLKAAAEELAKLAEG